MPRSTKRCQSTRTISAKRQPLGVPRAGDHRPRHPLVLVGGSRPLDIGDCDPAARTAGDGPDDIVITEGADIAVALRPLFARVHRRRDVDSEHERQVDAGRVFGRQHRRARDRKRKATAKTQGPRGFGPSPCPIERSRIPTVRLRLRRHAGAASPGRVMCQRDRLRPWPLAVRGSASEMVGLPIAMEAWRCFWQNERIQRDRGLLRRCVIAPERVAVGPAVAGTAPSAPRAALSRRGIPSTIRSRMPGRTDTKISRRLWLVNEPHAPDPHVARVQCRKTRPPFRPRGR